MCVDKYKSSEKHKSVEEIVNIEKCGVKYKCVDKYSVEEITKEWIKVAVLGHSSYVHIESWMMYLWSITILGHGPRLGGGHTFGVGVRDCGGRMLSEVVVVVSSAGGSLILIRGCGGRMLCWGSRWSYIYIFITLVPDILKTRLSWNYQVA